MELAVCTLRMLAWHAGLLADAYEYTATLYLPKFNLNLVYWLDSQGLKGKFTINKFSTSRAITSAGLHAARCSARSRSRQAECWPSNSPNHPIHQLILRHTLTAPRAVAMGCAASSGPGSSDDHVITTSSSRHHRGESRATPLRTARTESSTVPLSFGHTSLPTAHAAPIRTTSIRHRSDGSEDVATAPDTAKPDMARSQEQIAARLEEMEEVGAAAADAIEQMAKRFRKLDGGHRAIRADQNWTNACLMKLGVALSALQRNAARQEGVAQAELRELRKESEAAVRRMAEEVTHATEQTAAVVATNQDGAEKLCNLSKVLDNIPARVLRSIPSGSPRLCSLGAFGRARKAAIAAAGRAERAHGSGKSSDGSRESHERTVGSATTRFMG
eukprot:SAG31_NODE_2754_length_5137_cov_2.875645_2_plen_388_part_00